MRTRDLTIRSAAVLLVLTAAAILVHGYHPGAEDDFVYLPAIKHNLNPALYPHDADFFRLQLQATVFDKVVAESVRLTYVPLEWALLLWQAGAIFLVLLGCWKIARRCFVGDHARWAAVALIAALLTMPVAGTALFLVDQHLHPRALATAFILFAISAVLDRRMVRAIIWIVVAFAFHPIMAAFGASYCVFLAWPGKTVTGEATGASQVPAEKLSARTPENPSAPDQPCHSERSEESLPAQPTPLGSVLLPLAFSRCGSIAAAALIPLGWILEKPTAAWREAAATRSYYFLGKQEWYEWLGTLAPLAILWWLSRISQHEAHPVASPQGCGTPIVDVTDRPVTGCPNGPMPLMCRRLFWFALFQFAVTLAIMLPPQIERFRTLQPLRYLHLVYLLMLLFAGGLIGQYALKTKAWRWAVLFLPIAAGMFYAQREEFPASAHIELGRAVEKNPWERAFLWARNNTPVDAYFALGPRYYELPGEDWHSFRAVAERSHLADALKDPSVSTQVPRLAIRWQAESHAQDGWEKFQKPDFERLKSDFGVNWVVVDREVSGLICPFSTGATPVIRVCRID